MWVRLRWVLIHAANERGRGGGSSSPLGSLSLSVSDGDGDAPASRLRLRRLSRRVSPARAWQAQHPSTARVCLCLRIAVYNGPRQAQHPSTARVCLCLRIAVYNGPRQAQHPSRARVCPHAHALHLSLARAPVRATDETTRAREVHLQNRRVRGHGSAPPRTRAAA